jgi:hypothetical protein
MSGEHDALPRPTFIAVRMRLPSPSAIVVAWRCEHVYDLTGLQNLHGVLDAARNRVAVTGMKLRRDPIGCLAVRPLMT